MNQGSSHRCRHGPRRGGTGRGATGGERREGRRGGRLITAPWLSLLSKCFRWCTRRDVVHLTHPLLLPLVVIHTPALWLLVACRVEVGIALTLWFEFFYLEGVGCTKGSDRTTVSNHETLIPGVFSVLASQSCSACYFTAIASVNQFTFSGTVSIKTSALSSIEQPGLKGRPPHST